MRTVDVQREKTNRAPMSEWCDLISPDDMVVRRNFEELFRSGMRSGKIKAQKETPRSFRRRVLTRCEVRDFLATYDVRLAWLQRNIPKNAPPKTLVIKALNIELSKGANKGDAIANVCESLHITRQMARDLYRETSTELRARVKTPRTRSSR